MSHIRHQECEIARVHKPSIRSKSILKSPLHSRSISNNFIRLLDYSKNLEIDFARPLARENVKKLNYIVHFLFTEAFLLPFLNSSFPPLCSSSLPSTLMPSVIRAWRQEASAPDLVTYSWPPDFSSSAAFRPSRRAGVGALLLS